MKPGRSSVIWHLINICCVIGPLGWWSDTTPRSTLSFGCGQTIERGAPLLARQLWVCPTICQPLTNLLLSTEVRTRRGAVPQRLTQLGADRGPNTAHRGGGGGGTPCTASPHRLPPLPRLPSPTASGGGYRRRHRAKPPAVGRRAGAADHYRRTALSGQGRAETRAGRLVAAAMLLEPADKLPAPHKTRLSCRPPAGAAADVYHRVVFGGSGHSEGHSREPTTATGPPPVTLIRRPARSLSQRHAGRAPPALSADALRRLTALARPAIPPPAVFRVIRS